MHFRTHIPEEAAGISGQGFYADAMVLHDQAVGKLLDKLDELGIAEDTIVLYSTDNGPHYNTWPDAAITPWRSEKNSNWEGAYRVPSFARWPGKFEAGKVLNGIASHQDWLPTLLAAAGEPDIKQKLLDGHQAGDKEFNVFIDGENLLPWLIGEVDKSPRKFFALCQRRRGAGGVARRGLEGRVPGAARQDDAALGRAVRGVARAQALQPAPGSVRARR